MAVFRFYDLHSGGYSKIPDPGVAYIRAETEEEALVLFEEQYGVDPKGSACSCCGPDFSYYEIDEEDLTNDEE